MRENAMASGRLDATDALILTALSRNPRASVTSIAERTQLARGTVHARLNRIEQILSPYERRVPPAALGLGLTAFVQVQASPAAVSGLSTTLAAIPEVIEAFAISGEWDILVRIAAHDADDLYRVNDLIGSSPGVERTAITLAMRSLVAPRMAPLVERAARPALMARKPQNG